jgi:hypothetical protein
VWQKNEYAEVKDLADPAQGSLCSEPTSLGGDEHPFQELGSHVQFGSGDSAKVPIDIELTLIVTSHLVMYSMLGPNSLRKRKG